MAMRILWRNKKMSFKYEVLETYQAGLALLGQEVKSLKTQPPSLDGSYIVITLKDNKRRVVIRGLSIPPYQAQNQSPTYEAQRDRLLLLQKKEIDKLERALHTKGTTLVPQALGVERGRVKVQIALVRGKKKYDKRQTIKRRDQQRDAERESKVNFS